MKASEVIELLKLAIAEHGDLDVAAEVDGQRSRLPDYGFGLDARNRDTFVFFEDDWPRIPIPSRTVKPGAFLKNLELRGPRGSRYAVIHDDGKALVDADGVVVGWIEYANGRWGLD